ncbi:uncharacterized protein L203_100981 [Cryptococcus depauperatus CBS 7841]|uniref:Uncharacterized protein n=1 Tax=Cryptococcus depauperatus CBS 7841 TaxID=1295531 RepID=A0A1E3I9B0_9TREE|nr:hypothetical protein L203_05182 [Cryptococcus depauperatus CBS 7841]
MSRPSINMIVPSAEFRISQKVSFEPRYSQPFTPEEASHLEVDALVAELLRLINSITQLYSTQDQLKDFLGSKDGEQDPEGQQAAQEAIRENDELIPRQSERIAIISVALINKVGGDMRVGPGCLKVEDVFARYQAYAVDEKRRRWWEDDVFMEEVGLHL